MNYKMIANLIGRILVLEAAFLLPAAGISLYYQETKSCQAIVISAVVTALFGVAPVSYTHLDVYKRQIQNLVNTPVPLVPIRKPPGSPVLIRKDGNYPYM